MFPVVRLSFKLSHSLILTRPYTDKYVPSLQENSGSLRLSSGRESTSDVLSVGLAAIDERVVEDPAGMEVGSAAESMEDVEDVEEDVEDVKELAKIEDVVGTASIAVSGGDVAVVTAADMLDEEEA
jgi:cell division protein FtsX